MVPSESSNGIPTRPLGATGERVSILGLGGYHIGNPGREQGIRIIRAAIDGGINFLDNACDYHEGESERTMGQALRDGYRERVFLMTKNHGRDAASFRRTLETSLRRLLVEQIDLIQLHAIVDEGEPKAIYSQGAIEEAVRAREQGLLRFIGFTGHRHPHILLQMLEGGFNWDTAQFPVNLADHHFRSFARDFLPQAQARGLGLIGMKSLSSGELLKAGVSAREALSYALSKPVSTVVSGMDSLEVLSQNLETARQWRPLSDAESQALLDRVRPLAAEGRLERHKTD